MTDNADRLREADIARAYEQLSRITRRAAVRARGPESALSIVDHSLVDFVAQHPGCMAIDIARFLRLNRSTISRQLAGLVAAGLVATTDSGSGNAKPLRVTATGHEALIRTVRVHRDSLDARLADWSDDDVALLAGLLERLGATDAGDATAVSDGDAPADGAAASRGAAVPGGDAPRLQSGGSRRGPRSAAPEG